MNFNFKFNERLVDDIFGDIFHQKLRRIKFEKIKIN